LSADKYQKEGIYSQCNEKRGYHRFHPGAGTLYLLDNGFVNSTAENKAEQNPEDNFKQPVFHHLFDYIHVLSVFLIRFSSKTIIVGDSEFFHCPNPNTFKFPLYRNQFILADYPLVLLIPPGEQ